MAKKNSTVIKVKKTSKTVDTPFYATSGAVGMDIKATSFKIDECGNYVYGTGLAFELPDGWGVFLLPRSSNSKTDLVLMNSIGLGDTDYRGEYSFKFRPICEHPRRYNVGDRIGQLVFMPIPRIEFEEVEQLSETERGNGGYGSTGK